MELRFWTVFGAQETEIGVEACNRLGYPGNSLPPLFWGWDPKMLPMSKDESEIEQP